MTDRQPRSLRGHAHFYNMVGGLLLAYMLQIIGAIQSSTAISPSASAASDATTAAQSDAAPAYTPISALVSDLAGSRMLSADGICALTISSHQDQSSHLELTRLLALGSSPLIPAHLTLKGDIPTVQRINGLDCRHDLVLLESAEQGLQLTQLNENKSGAFMAPLDDYDLDPFRAANLTTIQDGFLLGLVQTDSGDLCFLAQPLIDEQGRPNPNGILVRHELPYSNGVPSFQSQHAALSPDLCAVIVHTALGYRLLVWALAANTTTMVGEPQDLGEVSPDAHVVARGNKMLYQTIDGTVYVATVSRTSASPSASVLAPVSIYNAQQSALLTLSNDWLAISHGQDGSRSITLMIPHTVDQSGAPVLIMANATQLLQAYTPTAVGLLNFTAVLSYPCTTTVVTYCRHSAYSRECNVMSPNTCPTPTTTTTTTAAAATVVSTESTSSVAPTASPSTLTAGELVPDRSSHVLAWALAGSLASFVLGALVVYQLSRRRRRRKLQYLYLASEDPSDKFTELHPDDAASTCGLEEKNASAGQGPSMHALEADLECRETQLYTQSAIQAFLQGEEVEALQIVHSSRSILEADELGRNILTLACLHNSDWLVFELTQHPQFDNLVKQYDQRGYTAFHWAILVSSYEIIERLLQVKYDLLMVPTLDGNLALHLLIRENRHEILRRLLDFKRRLLRLQILEEDENGLMPLERCDHYGADECRSLLQSVYDETVDTSKPLSANRTRFKRAIIMRLQRLRGGHQSSPVLVNAQA